jgi:hypothetical protein
MLKVARAVGWAADWHTLQSRPTIARIMERTGLSERTVQRWCRWLEVRGLLAVLEPGTTPQFSPGVLCTGGRNTAREWLLVDPTVTPSQVLDLDPERSAPTRAPAREDRGKAQRQGAAPGFGDHLVLRRVSPAMLRHILRPWAAAGWTEADVRHALDARPDGSPWLHSDAVRVPHAWLRHRLSAWLDEAGQPLPPHSASLAQRAERDRAQRWTAPPPKPPQVAVKGAQMARQMLRIAGQSL